MASVQENNLVALGKAAYEARVAIRGAKAELARELGFANGGAMSICADRIFYGKVAPSRMNGNGNGNGNGNNGTATTIQPTSLVNGYWSLPLVQALRSWAELREVKAPDFDIKQSVIDFLQSWAMNGAFNKFMAEKQRDGFAHELRNAGVKTASMLEAEQKAQEALAVSIKQATLLLEGNGFVVLTGQDELPLVSDLDNALDSGDYKKAQGLWLQLESLEAKHAKACKYMEKLDLMAMESVEVREGYQSLVDALREKACKAEIENDTPPPDQAAIDAAELEAFRKWKASQA